MAKSWKNAMLAAAAMAAPLFSVAQASVQTEAAQDQSDKDGPKRWNHGNRGTPPWVAMSAGRRQAQRRKDARRSNRH